MKVALPVVEDAENEPIDNTVYLASIVENQLRIFLVTIKRIFLSNRNGDNPILDISEVKVIQIDILIKVLRTDCKRIEVVVIDFENIIKVDFRLFYQGMFILGVEKIYCYITNKVLDNVLVFVIKILSIKYGEFIKEEKILIFLVEMDINIPDSEDIDPIEVEENWKNNTLLGGTFPDPTANLLIPNYIV